MKINTRQLILDKSLKLFSINGFEGVSVKEIANEVGIKDSSLYKHFNSKQAIFDTLLAEMNEKFEQRVTDYKLPQGDIATVATSYAKNDFADLKRACETVFEFFLKDEKAAQFRRMLTIEQMKNEKVSETFKSWFLDDAIDFQTNLISQLMNQNYLLKNDPSILALQFYAPFYTLIIQYDMEPKKYDEARSKLLAHIDLFLMSNKTEKEN